MSASDRLAAMPFITALCRKAGLPSSDLKSRSCLARYSANWPAIFGFAAATLLPSAAWHAAHTWPATAGGLSWLNAKPATSIAAATATARFIP